jgi:hypothetical protein
MDHATHLYSLLTLERMLKNFMKMDSGGRSIFRMAGVVCQMIAWMDNLTKEFVGGGGSKCFETVDNVGL